MSCYVPGGGGGAIFASFCFSFGRWKMNGGEGVKEKGRGNGGEGKKKNKEDKGRWGRREVDREMLANMFNLLQ